MSKAGIHCELPATNIRLYSAQASEALHISFTIIYPIPFFHTPTWRYCLTANTDHGTPESREGTSHTTCGMACPHTTPNGSICTWDVDPPNVSHERRDGESCERCDGNGSARGNNCGQGTGGIDGQPPGGKPLKNAFDEVFDQEDRRLADVEQLGGGESGDGFRFINIDGSPDPARRGFDDFIDWGDGSLFQARYTGEKRECRENGNAVRRGVQVESSPASDGIGESTDSQSNMDAAWSPDFGDMESSISLQNFMQMASPPASGGTGGASAIMAVNAGKRRHDSDETIPDIHPTKKLHTEIQRVSRAEENVLRSMSGRYPGVEMQQVNESKVDTDPSMASSLLSTPPLINDYGNERSPASTNLQSPFQMPNSALDLAQQPAMLTERTPTSQPQIWHPVIEQAEEREDFRVPALNFASPFDLSPQTQTYHCHPLTSIMPSQSNMMNEWEAGQQQKYPQHLEPYPGPVTMANRSFAIPGQPNFTQQRNLAGGMPAKIQSSFTCNEQPLTLQADIMNEIQQHLDTLTRYFSHVRRHQFKDVSPAKAQAVQHWLESAKHWESGVPETLKARLPMAPTHANPVQGMLFRHMRIQVMLESERRESLGMRWQSSREWQDDINIAAYKEQVRLMKTWSRMFNGMFLSLRFGFPLFDDALQEFQRAGGWSHLLGPDGRAHVDGVL